MCKSLTTREKLLESGRRMIWARGYANVPVREIASAAAVDVALINRYFGSKRGLFEATLEGAFDAPALEVEDREALVDALVDIFVNAPRDESAPPSIVRMILMNAHDPEVGELVRGAHQNWIQSRLETIVGDSDQAALLMAVLLGLSVAEKTLRLEGIAKPGTATYAAQLRHMMQAALAFEAK